MNKLPDLDIKHGIDLSSKQPGTKAHYKLLDQAALIVKAKASKEKHVYCFGCSALPQNKARIPCRIIDETSHMFKIVLWRELGDACVKTVSKGSVLLRAFAG